MGNNQNKLGTEAENRQPAIQPESQKPKQGFDVNKHGVRITILVPMTIIVPLSDKMSDQEANVIYRDTAERAQEYARNLSGGIPAQWFRSPALGNPGRNETKRTTVPVPGMLITESYDRETGEIIGKKVTENLYPQETFKGPDGKRQWKDVDKVDCTFTAKMKGARTVEDSFNGLDDLI